MLSDLRFACRTLARNRIFTLVTVLTLALGIGSAAAIFSVTDWILFRASKFPDDVFLIGGRNDQTASMPIRMDFMVRAYAEQTNTIAAYAEAAPMTGNIVIDGEPVATSWLGVSPNLFPMLGVAPTLGRGFLPGEDVEGADQVVVVSHQFWQSHFWGRADALGRKITVGDNVCTVVGVLREAQNLPAYFYNDVFRPLAYRVNPAQPWLPTLFLLGKVRPGFTREQAEQSLATVKLDVPPILRQFVVNDRPVFSSMGEVNQLMRAEIYWVMLGAVGFLYAIACLNASNLMLVRMLGQRRELSIRLALGGGRWRIIRLLAVESVTLAVLASLAGLLVANWFFPLLLSAAGSSAFAPNWTSWTLGWRVVGVMGLLTVATSLLIVTIPAFRILRTEIYSGLKDGGSALGESPELARLRGLFVIMQAAFAVILLAGAGLMIRTFHQLQKVDLGFDPAGRAKVQLGFPSDYPLEPEPRLARLREIQAELQRVPGVAAVGFGSDVMLSGYYFSQFTLEGPEGRPLKAMMLGFNIGFQDASGLKLKRGHWLTQTMGNEVLVNEAFARACWPGQDPIGQFLRPVTGVSDLPAGWKGWTVAGVIGDIHTTLRDAPEFYIYSPEGWAPFNFNTFVVRLSRDYDETFGGLIRRKLYAFNPRIVVSQIQPLNGVRDNQLWAERMANSVLKVLAGIALLLTVVGLFSVLAYTVDRRLGEFGVRMAMGATPGDLMQLVMRRGVLLASAGIVLGLAGSIALTRYLQRLLFETSAQDPWVLAAVGGTLLITSVLACALPARRAAKVDITRLLRSE
jgi:putative ABC transport system permease protein